MKTTILISSFAALCLMITFAESPSSSRADKNNAGPVDRISFGPAKSLHTLQEHKLSLRTTKTADGVNPVLIAEDFSYLKFKVADFIEKVDDASAESGVIKALPEPNCSYLKFDINDYTDKAEFSSFEAYELPVNDFAYLRFDVEYYEEKNSDSFENMDLPAYNFIYKKFDVNDYTDNEEVSSVDAYELTVNDFAYLRFDVEYYEEANSDSFENMDLPADNFSYLKFDVHEYFVGSEMEAGLLGELPVAETQPFAGL